MNSSGGNNKGPVEVKNVQLHSPDPPIGTPTVVDEDTVCGVGAIKSVMGLWK